MLEFEPPLMVCVVSPNDFSFAAHEATRDRALNTPTAGMAAQVVRCSNSAVDIRRGLMYQCPGNWSRLNIWSMSLRA